MIYWSRSHYILNTAVGAVRLPRLLDPLWRRWAYKPRIFRLKRRW